MPKKPKMNREWHAANRMPRHPTPEQRLAWHVEHAKFCACRPMPASVRAALPRGKPGRTHRPRLAAIDFRPGTPADLDALLPAFRAYQAHYRQLTTAGEAQTRAFLAELLESPERGLVELAWSGSTLAGFATGFATVSGVIAQRLIHLGDLYVVPAFRRRGVATRLVHRVAAAARARNIPLVRWLSLAENTTLNAWYASLGATQNDFALFLLDTSKVPEST